MEITAIAHPTTPDAQRFAQTVCAARRSIAVAAQVLLADPASADRRMGVARTAAGSASEHLYDLRELTGHDEALREALVAADVLASCAQALCDPEEGGDFGRATIAQQLAGVDRSLATIERQLGIEHAHPHVTL